MTTRLAEEVWRDFVDDGLPASGKHKPKKSHIRLWGSEIEALLDIVIAGGGFVYATKAALEADLAKAAGSGAWVYADTTAANNGIYRKIGNSGTGSWTRATDLPQSVIGLTVTGGTANAIECSSTLPVPQGNRNALFILLPTAPNTGAVTLEINGASPVALKWQAGEDLGNGHLQANVPVLFFKNGSEFRLTQDDSFAGMLAAAQTAAATATTQAGIATTKASESAVSESNAATAASTATTQAGIATTKAAESADSASDASDLLFEFRQHYLGALPAAPTLDGNGDPVAAGAEYFDTILGYTRVYNGTTWQTQSLGPAGPAGAAGDLVGSYVKGPFDAATTGPVTLSGLQTIDGFVGADGSRILVLHQDNPAQNGGYVMASGAWPRTTDMDTAAEVSGALCLIKKGPGVNAGKLFKITQQITTLGTDRILIDDVPQGGSVRDQFGRSRGVYVSFGDSNYGGRPGWWSAINREWRSGRHPLALWTHWNIAQSGYGVTGALSSIVSGAQNAAPVDINPSVNPNAWGGNIYAAVNAFADTGGVLEVSLGINDLGIATVRASFDTVNRFAEYLDRVVYWFLAKLPHVAINLTIPAPFAGEDFIQGINVTEWATMPGSGGSVDEGAALASNIVRQAYLKWIGRHPRVSVFDTKEIFGTRCDDKAVNSQDPEGQGALLDDTLHFSDLAARRLTQHLTRHYGISFRARRDTSSIMLPPSEVVDSFWRQWFINEQAGVISGADTRLTPYSDPGALFTKSSRAARRTASLLVPTADLDRADLAEFFRSANPRELLTLRRDFKLYFPGTGNIYTPTGLTLFQVSTVPEGLPRIILTFLGVNIAADDRAAGALWCVYATTRFGRPFQNFVCQFNADGTGGGGAAHNPYDFEWYPTAFRFNRGIGTNAIDVKIYAQNLTDGRLIDGALNSGTAPGMIVAEGALINGGYDATLTLNATNWPSGFPFKAAYRLVGRVTSGTMIGQGSFTVRT